MSILIIYPQLDLAYTGGQIYDFNIFKNIQNQQKDFETLLDKDLHANNLISYQIALIKNLNKIRKFNTIITNSRLYPKLLFLFILLKFIKREIRLVVIHHHFNYMTQHGLKRCIHKFLETSFLRKSDVVIIPSPYIKSLMQKYLPAVNTKYIELAFDINISSPTSTKITKKKNHLLFVGTIERRKGISYLISMTEFLVNKKLNFHLDIVGNISSQKYYNSLLEQIERKNLNSYITFHGRISEEELNRLYSASEIFVFPSLHEGYGIVILEAMSHSIPVVAFNNSAMPYTIKHMVNGMLVDNKDSDDFNDKVLQLMKNRKLLEQLSLNAYKTYEGSRKKEEMDFEISSFIKSL